MPALSGSPAIERLVGFLGELGPRWGLPAEACRVHGLLYLLARPVSEAEMAKALGFKTKTLRKALDWLSEYRLVTARGDLWSTGSDPWELMLRALEERRRRELAPALDILRECWELAAEDSREGRAVSAQIGKLLAMAEDLAAIDAQARRLSPQALRGLMRLGGRAARLIDRTTRRRGQE